MSHLDADTEYGYDEDWTCHDASRPTACEAGLFVDSDGNPWGYESTDLYLRDRKNSSVELLLLSEKDASLQWLTGLFIQNRETQLQRRYNSPINTFSSDYQTDTLAIFGQLTWQLDEKLNFKAGLRLEQADSDYLDSNQIVESADDTMLGGKLALEYQVTPRTLLYTSLVRGFKAGGINGQAIAEANNEGVSSNLTDQQQFKAEYNWNLEFGVKGRSADGNTTVRLAAFHMWRDQVQLSSGQIIPVPNNPGASKFIDFIDNASEGSNLGIEAEALFTLAKQWQFDISAGFLDTEFRDYMPSPDLNLDGRDLAHAPQYQYAATLHYSPTESLILSLGVEGKDDFFFSDSHNARSNTYNLINARISYQIADWELVIWGKNLADKDYAVRGFRFGNDPRLFYDTRTYIQLGEPRLAGANVQYQF